MKVLLDTNFLLIPFTNHVDVFAEIERLLEGKVRFLVMESSLRELRALRGRERLNARAMLQFIEAQSGRFGILGGGGKTDKLILGYAEGKKGELLVATMDKRLRDELKGKGVKAVALRGKGHLEII